MYNYVKKYTDNSVGYCASIRHVISLRFLLALKPIEAEFKLVAVTENSKSSGANA